MSIPSTGLGHDGLHLVWGASGIRKLLHLNSDAEVYGLIKSGALDGAIVKIGRGKRKRIAGIVPKLIERFETLAATA
jgi:hypothetical protein